MSKKSVAIKKVKKLYKQKNKLAKRLIKAGLFDEPSIWDFTEINETLRFTDILSETEMDNLEARLETDDLREVLDFLAS